MLRGGLRFGAALASVLLSACGGGEGSVGAPDLTNQGTTHDEAAGSDHAGGAATHARRLPNRFPFANASGFAATYSTQGDIDLSGPFFQSLGTNGRACSSCHRAEEGWTITPAGVRARFELTAGTDPLFRTNDGSNSPTADVSTVEKRRVAYSMLLTKGLIRVSNPVPAGADYTLVAVDDPYGHASAADVSTFRRPLPSANLDVLSTVMWDGRETQTTVETDTDLMGCSLAPTAPKCWKTIHTDLLQQANDATLGHAQATLGLLPAQQEDIVAFESSLFVAQIFDGDALDLTAAGAQGGPLALSGRLFYFGENDVLSGDYRTHAPFDAKVFDEFDAWGQLAGRGPVIEARRAVARGQEIFNSHPIAISGVKGINDDFGIPVLNGTCTTCHDMQHGGAHSIPAPLDIGLTGDHPEALARTPDLPLYTFRRTADGATFTTTDPGRGLITGKFKDLGRFKGPVLRGLATRARRTSTTARRRRSRTSSASTTAASPSGSPKTRSRTSWRSSERSDGARASGARRPLGLGEREGRAAHALFVPRAIGPVDETNDPFRVDHERREGADAERLHDLRSTLVEDQP